MELVIAGDRDPRVPRAVVRLPQEPHDGDCTEPDRAGRRTGRSETHCARRSAGLLVANAVVFIYLESAFSTRAAVSSQVH